MDYPDLAEVKPGGKIVLKVRLYKYHRSSTARILDLKDQKSGDLGGSAVLARFIGTYKKETDKFKAPGQKNPVIILYDNDSGAGPIRNSLKQASGKKVDGTEPFVRVIRNLYAVPTPPVNGVQNTKIEDCFDAATKAIPIGSKTFNDGDNFDPEKHFGKKVFAHRVVRVRADTINFEGFRPVLTNLVAVIKSHAEAQAATTTP
jgi:hypothetical protein